jgi:phosphate transport system substrate-binding protein
MLHRLDDDGRPDRARQSPAERTSILYCKPLARLLPAVVIASVLTGATAATASADLNGAGSTLIAPLEAKWAAVYESDHSGVAINYQSVGSGKGESAIAAGTVDFGASDAPLSAYSTPCNGCYQIPWALTATGVGFHVNGIRTLRLSGAVIAQIYLGRIRRWNDRRIRSLNPSKHLPNLKITPYWRNDASGDTYAFTDYLSKVYGPFRRRVGDSTVVNWPTGVGARGNLGMVQALSATNGGIAYVAVAYLAADWPYVAAIKNRAGRWEVPNLRNIASAAASVHHVPGNDQVDITNASGHISYPISTFTYVIAPGNAPQGGLLRSFIGYALSAQGQALGYQLDFVPVPGLIRQADLATAGRIR